MQVNIISLYIIKIAKWFNLIMPTIVLFYHQMGLGMQEIMFLKAIYSMAIVLFEIPSGYCADIWGRKKTLLFGGILGMLGIVIYSANTLFLGFAVAEIILGLGHSFISGADTAMLYDTLKSNQKTATYLKHEGRITAGGNFAEALAGILGGLLATISLRTPFYFQAVVAASAIPAAMFLKEPALDTLRHQKKNFKDLIRTVRRSFTRNTMLGGTILISALTGTATLTFAWLVQPYFKATGLPLALYGVMWTLLNLTVGTTGLFAYKLEAKWNRQKITAMLALLITGGYFLAGFYVSLKAVWVLFLFYAVRGVATPVFKEYIHRYCESEVRATVLSLRNFIIRIIFAIIGPLLGWVMDHYSLTAAFWAMGGFYGMTTGVALLIFHIQLKTGSQSLEPNSSGRIA